MRAAGQYLSICLIAFVCGDSQFLRSRRVKMWLTVPADRELRPTVTMQQRLLCHRRSDLFTWFILGMALFRSKRVDCWLGSTECGDWIELSASDGVDSKHDDEVRAMEVIQILRLWWLVRDYGKCGTRYWLVRGSPCNEERLNSLLPKSPSLLWDGYCVRTISSPSLTVAQ